MSTILRSDSQSTWVLASEWSAAAFVVISPQSRAESLSVCAMVSCRLPASMIVCSHSFFSHWARSLKQYCDASASPVCAHVHNYSAFAVRQLESESWRTTFVLGADAWSSA